MRLGILGLDLNSGNKGCEALAYGFLEILNSLGHDNKEKTDVFLLQKIPTKQLLKSGFSLKKIKKEYTPKYKFSELEIDIIFLAHTSKTVFFNYQIKKLDFVIDFTGGDSFTDIYGLNRFYERTRFKDCIMKHGVPLILGSQTIGPFENPEARAYAVEVIRKVRQAFARDELSFQYMKEISGREPVLVTDVAFALPYTRVEFPQSQRIRVGFNPSGLLWNGGYSADNQFGLAVEYKEYCYKVMDYLTQDPRFEVHLILHSFEDNDTNIADNDLIPARILQSKYPSTIMSPLFNSCIDAKSYIAGMDILIGARMHATIAGFSSCVPVIPFAYSRKFQGLFNSLDYEYVIDARKMTTNEALSKTIKWINQRDVLLADVRKGAHIIDKKMNVFKDELLRIMQKSK